jgi:hypothetical protein
MDTVKLPGMLLQLLTENEPSSRFIFLHNDKICGIKFSQGMRQEGGEIYKLLTAGRRC